MAVGIVGSGIGMAASALTVGTPLTVGSDGKSDANVDGICSTGLVDGSAGRLGTPGVAGSAGKEGSDGIGIGGGVVEGTASALVLPDWAKAGPVGAAADDGGTLTEVPLAVTVTVLAWPAAGAAIARIVAAPISRACFDHFGRTHETTVTSSQRMSRK
jgi:hypothetical protein